MDATLVELPVQADAISGRGAELSALVDKLLDEVGQLRREVRELRQEAGYWKGMFAQAKQKNEKLQKQIDELRAENRQLKDKLYGTKSEKKSSQDRSNQLEDPSQPDSGPKRSRGHQPNTPGPRRRDHSHLPVVEEPVELPHDQCLCPKCGKLREEMAETEDSELIEIDVRAYRRLIRRKRYRATCDCPEVPRTLTAPAPAKLIPKGRYGISVWVHVLLDKFASYRATANLIEQLKLYDLALPPGTITQSLKSLQSHWSGLTVFVDDPKIPMDNNASERIVRGPVMGRKNYYGSGSLWSASLAATMFSILATLKRWNLNPLRWLTWYLESCAAAGGKPASQIESFLPWNLSDQRREELTGPVPPVASIDSS